MAESAVRKQVYTTDHSSAVLRTHSWRTLANSAAYVIPHLRPGMTVLDVGCGPGSLTVDLAKRVAPEGGKVVGIDYVADPLDSARQNAVDQEVTNVEFKVGDIHALEFPDESFDLVHAHQVLQHIADPVQGLREMRRVTKRGGIVALRESAAMSWYPESEGISAWWNLFQRMGKEKGGNLEPGRYVHVWAQEAGFERDSITCSAGSWCFASREEREYIGGTFAERMLSSGFATAAVEGGFATEEELAKISASWRAFVNDDNGWLGILHGELICRK
ncbi:conserved hypothetical protein [Uncinocarpus reesii 1704]|uniref:Methyltransferase domain-containing protein n=1 Tax=Uncinocarpus reesii (strain UAMH 1704) TaxID=336963 RepID=C4JRI0_UNCRE|nr:uncharacterized protein UREG_05069 [Uncinocarpus reesii 1704]EEP80227.1 conserved hypothetical protein [Uncinocarpus reesii 1704]